jgi:LysM repeat protein
MAVIDTALESSAVGDGYVSPTHSPTIEEAFGGPDHLKLLQGALDDWGDEELKDEQTAITTPRDSAAPPPPAPPKETPMSSSDGAQAHTVISGDTLSQIAIDNGVTLEALIAANPQFAANPDLIFPGQQVTLPTGSEIADGGEVNQQVTVPAGEETADGSEASQAASVEIPPAGEDPLYDRMGWVEDTPDSRANALQFSDWATQSSDIGGLTP